MDRVDVEPDPGNPYPFYKLLTSVVVPRPIAWVSTRSADGVDNLAPHSFFTVAAIDPPVVQFTSVGPKDSLRNVQATREFVVSLAPEELFEEVNATGTNFPAGESEFDAAGLERERSAKVAPPRVAGSPAVLECVLHATLGIGISTVVFGRVVHAAIAPGAMAQDGLPDVGALKPLSRLGRDEWGTVGGVREITRIGYDEWPGHFGGG